MDLEPQPVNILSTVIGILIAIAPWKMASYADTPTLYKVIISFAMIPLSYIVGSIIADK